MLNDRAVDVRRLRLLLELSRLGSMRAVADELDLTTSTVSQQIAALARDAGTPLLEPDGRRVRLTAAGRRLADHAVTILAAVDAARRDLDPGAEPSGTVRVAGFGSAIRRSLIPVVAELAESHPGVRLQVNESEPSEAFQLLASDDIDLALTYDYNLAPASWPPEVDVLELWTNPWGLGVPARDDAPSGDASAVFVAYTNHSWIGNSRYTGDEDAVRTLASIAGFTPTDRAPDRQSRAGRGADRIRPGNRPAAARPAAYPSRAGAATAQPRHRVPRLRRHSPRPRTLVAFSASARPPQR